MNVIQLETIFEDELINAYLEKMYMLVKETIQIYFVFQ